MTIIDILNGYAMTLLLARDDQDYVP